MEGRSVVNEQADAAEIFERALKNIPNLVEQFARQWETIRGDQETDSPSPDWAHVKEAAGKYSEHLLRVGIDDEQVLRCEVRPAQVTADATCHSPSERRRRENVRVVPQLACSSFVTIESPRPAAMYQVRTTEIQARLLVNDQELAILPWETMKWPSFSVDFLQKVPIRYVGEWLLRQGP